MARLLLKGTPVRFSTTTFLALATATAAALGGFSGCAGDPETFQPTGSTSGNGTSTTGGNGGGSGEGGSSGSGQGAGSGQGGGAVENRGPELFAALEEDLMGACGVCHDAGGTSNTPFLAGPDRYQTISSWPEVIKADWASSILLTYPVSGGGHSGINLDSSAYVDTLLPAVEEWLEEEAAGIVQGGEGGGGTGVGGGGGEEPDPTIDAFKPIIGFNAVYLHPLDEAFTGMAITFTATELTPSSLELTNIEVHTTSELGLHIVHPLFVVFPVGEEADPDPVDSFSNLDAYHEPGTGDPLGPGTLVLTNWSADAKLSIAFEQIELHDPSVGEGGGGGSAGGGMCEAQAEFDDVAGQFNPCLNCHNGQNAGATGAVDMRDLDNDTGLACIQIRNRVNLDTPANSQIFVVTNPDGGAGHPFKFGNDAGNWNNFRNAVTAWIDAEAAASN